jgi:hypothetical protein
MIMWGCTALVWHCSFATWRLRRALSYRRLLRPYQQTVVSTILLVPRWAEAMVVYLVSLFVRQYIRGGMCSLQAFTHLP